MSTEVNHNGETIEVPTTFDRTELAAWFGGVPESFEVDRIFQFEGGLRVESHIGDGEWVEAVRHTDDHHPTFNAQNDRGWVAEIVQGGEEDPDYPNEEDTDRYPGETVWVR